MAWWMWIMIGIVIVVVEELIAAPKRKARLEAMRRETERLNRICDDADKKLPNK
jgi:hypothetical protein